MNQMTNEIIWTGSPDDQTAVCGECTLRVIRMKEPEPYWWWKFFVGDNEIQTGDEPTIEQAKTACEKAYYEHLKTR